MAKVNTEAPITSGQNIVAAENNRRKLLEFYKECPKVKRSVSPLYAPYFGKVMQIQINGITIAMPIDGTFHDIPEPFADEIDARVMATDAIIKKGQKMSNISANAEAYPGALQMF